MKLDGGKHLVDGKYSIKDLVDLEELRALFQSFTDAMGFTIGFLSTPELEILIATGWRKICTQYHRNCPLAAERCRISNARLVRHCKRPGQIIIEACENGLVDCATPIIIKGKKVAILATGQVLLKPPNIEHFRKQAKLYGCNKAAYLRALKDVPVISPKKLKQATRFLGQLAHTIIQMGYASLEEKERSELLSREIHQRKNLEEALRVKNRAFDISLAATSIADTRGVITEANDAFLRAWGCRSRGEVIGKPLAHFLNDPREATAIFRALNKQGRWEGDFIAKKRDRSTFIAHTQATAVLNESGKLIGYQSAVADITERQRAEESLQESVKDWRDTFDAVNDAVWLLSLDGRILRANKSTRSVLGKKPEEILGRRCCEVVHGSRIPPIECPLHRMRKSRQRESWEFQDSNRWFRVTVDPIWDSKGVLIGAVHIVSDITARKEAGEALLASEDQYRNIFESSQDALMTLESPSWKFTSANTAMLRMFGAKNAAELFSHAPWVLSPKLQPDGRSSAKKAKKMIQIAIRQGSHAFEWTHRRIDGTAFPAEVLLTRVVKDKDKDKDIVSLQATVRDITARKKSEEALRESEEKFRLMFNTSAAGMAMCNMDGSLVEVNQAYLDIIGYTRKEALRLSYWDLTPKKYAKDEARQLRSMELTGKYGPYTKEYIRKTGERVDVMLTGAVVTGADGVKRIWSLVENITERKRSEELLKQREAYLTAIVDNQSGMVWLKDKESRFLAVNQVFAKMAGKKKPEDVVGKTDLDFWPPEMAKGYRADDRKVMRSRKSVSVEELISEKGVARWHETFKTPVFDSDGKVIGTTGYARDITERRRAEEALQESEKRFRVVVNNSLDLVYRRNIQTGRYDFFSPAVKKTLGFSSEELIGKKLSFATSRIHPEDLKVIMPVLKRAQAGLQRSGIVDYRCRHKDGTYRWLSDRFTIVDDANGRPFYWVGVSRDVTAAKVSAEALRKSETEKKLVLDNIPDLVVYQDTKNKIIWANSCTAKAFGKTVGELKGATCYKAFYNLDRPCAGCPVNKCKKTGLLEQMEMVSSDGRCWMISGSPVKDASGTVVGIVEVAVNITDRKKAEERLLFVNKAIESVNVAIGISDAQGHHFYQNKALSDLFGYATAQELDAAGGGSKVVKDPNVAKEMFSTVHKGRSWAGELEMVTKNGRVFPAYERADAVRDSKGNIMGLIGVITDITERKRALDSLREHRHQLLQVIDTVPHMIFAKDQKGRFLLANRAVAEAYGKEPKDLIGVRHQDVHKDRQEMKEFFKGDREVLSSLKPQLVANEPFTDSRGNRHILQTIKIPFKMIGIKDPCILGVSVDVTEQKKVEEFRNDIVRTVSHELRTPLSIEKEGISLLVDEMVGPVNAEQKEILETVMRSIDRLARMITSLLDISSIETRKIHLLQKVTNLVDLVNDVAFEFKKRAEDKGIELGVKVPRRLVRVFVDGDKLLQVLSNLVDNAIKFTPKGGTVGIALNVMKNSVECEVRDTGIGIAPENMGKLFEKFQQFSRKAGPGEKGFGLGLSIAKGIIELHGGQIWIKSELGKGTQATFSLPLHQTEGD